MEQEDMKITEDRERQIKEILIMLFEDQYGCRLVRSAKEKETSA